MYRASPASYAVRSSYYPRPRRPRRHLHVGRALALVLMSMVVALQVVSAGEVSDTAVITVSAAGTAGPSAAPAAAPAQVPVAAVLPNTSALDGSAASVAGWATLIAIVCLASASVLALVRRRPDNGA